MLPAAQAPLLYAVFRSAHRKFDDKTHNLGRQRRTTVPQVLLPPGQQIYVKSAAAVLLLLDGLSNGSTLSVRCVRVMSPSVAAASHRNNQIARPRSAKPYKWARNLLPHTQIVLRSRILNQNHKSATKSQHNAQNMKLICFLWQFNYYFCTEYEFHMDLSIKTTFSVKSRFNQSTNKFTKNHSGPLFSFSTRVPVHFCFYWIIEC